MWPTIRGDSTLFWHKQVIGSTLYQIQNGQPRLIGYASKRMWTAAQTYFITKLELYRSAINIVSFPHLLKRVNFDAVVDHLALTHIKNKSQNQQQIRFKDFYKFWVHINLISCLKGKDMVLNDFLSGIEGDKSDPHEVIPISFNSPS